MVLPCCNKMGLLLNSQKKEDIEWHFLFFFVHICGAYQRKKFWHFLFFIVFWILWDKRRTSREKKGRSEVRFFALKFFFYDKMSWNVVCFVTWHTCSNSDNKLHFQLSQVMKVCQQWYCLCQNELNVKITLFNKVEPANDMIRCGVDSGNEMVSVKV